MAVNDLTSSVDTTYADDPQDASVKVHQQDHDIIHDWLKAAGDISASVLTANSEIADLGNVVISAVADNEVLAYNTGTGEWINQTAAEAGLATSGHTHTTQSITSGTFTVDRGGTGISSYTTGNYINAANSTTLQQRTPTQVRTDIGAAATSHNHSASQITSGTFADLRIAQSNVTQHQAALSITESQISDLDHLTLEEVQDNLGTGFIVGGTDITVTYNDTSNTLTIDSTATGVTDHGALTGLGDDDHTQYYNAARHTKAVHDALSIDADTVDGQHASAFRLTSVQIGTTDIADDAVTADKLGVIFGGGNLIRNGSFDGYNNGFQGWTAVNCTLIESSDYFYGNTSGRVGYNGSATPYIHQTFFETVVPNDPYTISAWFRGGGGGSNVTVELEVQYFDDGGFYISSLLSTQANISSTTAWTYLEATGDAPSSALSARVYINFSNIASGESVLVDAVQFERSDVATSFSPRAEEVLPNAIGTVQIVDGAVTVPKGGTGITSYTTGNYINASGTTTLQQRTPAQVLSDIGAASSGHNHDSTYVNANTAITGATNTKITYDSKGLVTAGTSLVAADIPSLATSKITSGTFANALIAQSNVTQHQSAIDHGSIAGLADDDHTQYLNSARHDSQDHSTAMSTVVIADISNVIITSVADNEVLAYNSATSQWINKTAAEAGLASASHNHSATNITSGTLAVARGGTGLSSYTIGNYIYASGSTTLSQRTPAQVLSDIGAAASGHGHAASDITSGTFVDARIAQSNVTQHQAALNITESQISNLDHYTTTDANTDIDARVTKTFVDALNINADTVDGQHASAFASASHGTHVDLADAAPPNPVFGTGSAVGVSLQQAREDHVHALGTPATPISTSSSSGTVGTSGIPARSDHRHGFSTAVGSTQAFGDSASAGAASSISRSDHKHAMPVNPVTGHEAASDPHTVYILADGTRAFTGSVLLSDGTQSVPALARANSTSTGIWFDTDGIAGPRMNFSVVGTLIGRMSQTSMGMHTPLYMDGNAIHNVGTPDSDDDAVPKSYVDDTIDAMTFLLMGS